MNIHQFKVNAPLNDENVENYQNVFSSCPICQRYKLSNSHILFQANVS